MTWQVEWDGALVVGGRDSLRLTPNFRLREFRMPDGGLRVHRELVSALQLLRNRFGQGITVREVAEDGLEAVLGSKAPDALLRAADQLEDHRLFASAAVEGSGVRVRIPDPDDLPPIGLEQALETAFSITAAYETAGDKFQQVTGNFDGAGLSFGPAQVNFKTGTLEPLFERFRQADEKLLAGCFDDGDDWREWQRVLALDRWQDKVAWADAISTGRGKGSVSEPWRGYLKAVGRVERFKAIMVEEILRKYGKRLLQDVRFLQEVEPGIRVDHLRCVCSLYDVAIQQGGLGKAREEIRARVASERPADQFELVRIAVEERGKRAGRRWRADCISRRVGILDGVPKTVEESGETAQRANINFFMLRDVRVAGADEILKRAETEVDEELARVSGALAAGGTLLA
jgi:hypothetical protein